MRRGEGLRRIVKEEEEGMIEDIREGEGERREEEEGRMEEEKSIV